MGYLYDQPTADKEVEGWGAVKIWHQGSGRFGTWGRDKKSFRTTIRERQKKQWIAGPTKHKRSANITAHFALIAGSQERIV